MMVAQGGEGVAPHASLARLYLKQGQWRQSAREVLQAVKMIPFALWSGAQRLKKAAKSLACRVRQGMRLKSTGGSSKPQ
jgi:hypothetical protein